MSPYCSYNFLIAARYIELLELVEQRNGSRIAPEGSVNCAINRGESYTTNSYISNQTGSHQILSWRVFSSGTSPPSNSFREPS
ncbi:Protein of unknown function [Cotesia congregata]|uniref:Uncharacterized protein n=1 Tax=Cotesia congregata TaxID=51543 RepID=A0A8J2MJN5_COTCN|nr:Protein of unknown function [Cotesia congregata]